MPVSISICWVHLEEYIKKLQQKQIKFANVYIAWVQLNLRFPQLRPYSFLHLFIQLINVGSGPTMFKAHKQKLWVSRIHGMQILSLPNFILTGQKKLESRVERTLRNNDKAPVAINPKE